MPLKNSQYNQLMRDYQRRQLKHIHAQQSRIDELYDAVPALRETDRRLHELKVEKAAAKIYAAAAPARLSAVEAEITALSAQRAALMQSSGYSEDYTQLHYDCPKCRDTGYTENGKRCVCFLQAAIDLLYAECNIRDIIRSESFDTFSLNYYPDTALDEHFGETCRAHMAKVLQECRAYAASFPHCGGKSMLLTGPTGVGKTLLTHCIAREVIEQCCSVVYLTAPALFEMFERSMRASYEDESSDEIAQYLLESDLLIIDDLGTEMINSFTVSKLFFCLNERLVRRRSVLISTNLGAEELRNLYSERISSRIFSEYALLQLLGPDIRMLRKFNNIP